MITKGVRYFPKGVRDFKINDFICDFLIFYTTLFLVLDTVNSLRKVMLLDIGVFSKVFSASLK